MSLLMEALRKAELEKKKAAERLEQTVEHAVSRVSKDDAGSKQTGSAGESTSEHQITRMDRTHVRSKEELLAATANLTLEPIDAEAKQEIPASGDAVRSDLSRIDPSEDLTINVLMDRVQNDAVEKTVIEEAPRFEAVSEPVLLDEEMEIGSDSPLDESFHAAMADKTEELPGLYDETIQGKPYRTEEPERFYDETLPGVSALELFKDLGEENQPTPVAAQTVFTATASRTASRSGSKWLIVAGLAMVVIVAFSVVAYLAVTPLVNEIPEQQLAGELELIRPPLTIDTTPVASAPEPVAEPDILDSGSDAQQIVDTAAAGELQLPDESVAVAAVDAAPAEPDVTAPVLAAPVDPPAAAVDLNESTHPDLIKISRSKSTDEQGSLIKDAYLAYRSGNYNAARERYEGVLKIIPDNRDALLGLGAIAMKEGNIARVQEIYSRLFRLNPRDSIARAVLVNLDRQADPVSRESTLKVMISDNPEDAFLYFSLGNIYAVQSRWAEAQQAFFDAYRFDTTNAEYALNLAISLDRIGQYETALDYYNTALKLADEQPAEFDSAIILARIQSLTAMRSN